MNDKDTQHFKELLEKQLEEIEHTIGIMKENNTAQQDLNSPTELSNYDNHPAEIASELFQVEMNTALKIHEENILVQIKSALGRIGDGSYGNCVRCSAEIAHERLEVLPYAEKCIKCEQEDEDSPERRRKERPNEERVLRAPMGRKYLNKREDDEYEGMDQFNDLMKYGSSDGPQDLGGYHDYEEYYTNESDKQGIVDDMDRISNDVYRQQLPD
jgi:YteA family regulatory protein